MAGECVPEGPDLGDMSEEELWELINDNRHRISLGVRPCILIPYLRQARVLAEMDEDEILSSHNLTNRSMRTSYMLDLLRTQGRNGAVALLESLMIHYPTLYTQVTGRKPSTEPSRFSGLIKYSELTEYLVRAVTGMQKELQEARCEASKKSAHCASLQLEIRQIMDLEEKSRGLQAENERMRRHLCSLQRDVTKLKDEKCDVYMRYTAAIEEKSAVNMRLHDLNLFSSLTQTFYPHCSLTSVSRTSYPPFLMRSRPKAIRVNGRVLSISLQGEALLSQLTVVGGNKTGVFVHQVTEGTLAHTVGISRGAQIVEVRYEQNQKALKMVLEDSTLEEAMWALGQVTGLCHLSLRPRQDDYEALLQQLQSSETISGDSFYVRVNMSLSAGPNGTLAVSCNDILHVTHTRPAGTEDSWRASQVHPCQLLDLQTGNVPNYYRAQRLLIQAIEDMSFQTKKSRKVRIIRKYCHLVTASDISLCSLLVIFLSHNRLVYFISYIGDTSAPKSCLTLMPYSLVTPIFPPICRPVLLLPTILGHSLNKKVADWQGFQLCEPGRKHSGIHCVLPLGLDCVRRLHRAQIFPIIIFIGLSARSARKLKSKLQRHSQSEERLLACSKSEEPLLDKLPCLYHSVAPDSWSDQASLLTRLRSIIWEEQKKIVWVEHDQW
uniref:Caspase recruitment domain family member 14 n=1 Tax=Sander lucioperca TaxID=283035 RepID=A0A8D0CZE3_SANLU